jgi:hypothetical protein
VVFQKLSKLFYARSLIKDEGILECVIPTQHGKLNLLAEIEILDNNETLHIKDLIIYPENVSDSSLKGKLLREIITLRSQLQIAAHHLKFNRLKITAVRVKSSTSANPGHSINLNVELKFKNNGLE